MLKLTKKADYGLIALRHLALGETGATASAKEMADAYGLPLPLLAKILQKLARGGMLQSVSGTNGGYRLRRDPKQISAMEVIRAIDGPVVLTSCFTEHKNCNTSAMCTVREPLRRVHEAMLALLEKFTIAELAAAEAAGKKDRSSGGGHPIEHHIQISGILPGKDPAPAVVQKTELRHEDAYISG